MTTQELSDIKNRQGKRVAVDEQFGVCGRTYHDTAAADIATLIAEVERLRWNLEQDENWRDAEFGGCRSKSEGHPGAPQRP